MKIEEKITPNDTVEPGTKHSQSRHIKMMVICCGVPLLGIITIGLLGISLPSLETLLLVICPIGMGAMLWMMMREPRTSTKERSCCQPNDAHEKFAEHDKTTSQRV
jgi:hypothetical protein